MQTLWQEAEVFVLEHKSVSLCSFYLCTYNRSMIVNQEGGHSR